jgi:hypothetical protein
VAQIIGGVVALIAVAGSLTAGWSFDGVSDTVPTVIGVVVAATVVTWALYSRTSDVQ